MRLRTDLITREDIRNAARFAGVDFERLSEHTSRARNGIAWDVLLTGSSPHRPNSGHRGADGNSYAATWDEWGFFLAFLYNLDPGMIAGSTYRDGVHFHWLTADRFRGGVLPSEQHRKHKWEPHGSQDSGLGFRFYESGCDCGALQRWLHQVKWADIRDAVLADIVAGA